MASSSQQTSSSDFSYEVFLSFHGNDVRTGFADHLYHALDRVGIRTFRDAEELEPGKEIASNLLAAIRQSIISIPIFSMNYGCSKWCLNELKEISECRRTRSQIVLPIFYKIEPTNVRNQTGEYAKAFDDEHPKKFNKKTVQEWRDVLQEIGKLDGRHVKESLHEGALVKEIVTIVSNELNKRLVHVADDLVGIKSHIEKVVELLEITSEVTKIVGIYGFGGIGKTTIARAVRNEVLNKFEEHAFIEDVRENVKIFGIPYLQNKLITTILKDGIQNIIDVDSGIKVIKQRLCQKKVLLILDDVDKDSHIESLIGDGGWFGIGSKIIITTRNKDILTPRKAEIYEPGEMNLDDSLKLFSRYAFKSDQPLGDYLDLSTAMVEIIGKIPLALKVIGSSLFLKKKLVWEDMLMDLQKVPNTDVMERLKISYDGLEHAEQQMFLDTACFFIGMKINIVCYIWKSCGFSPHKGLDSLCAKSLITIEENDELRMHDVLRDLGRCIVHRESTKPEKRSRIWSKEEVLDVIVGQKGTNKCLGLTMDFDYESNDERSIIKGLDAMTELRLLKLGGTQILGKCRNSFSELRWLSWKGCADNSSSKLRQLSWRGFSRRFELRNFCPRKLVVLDLSYSRITKGWIGWDYIKMAEKLKVLKLEHCNMLCGTPDFSGNPLLEVLSLAHCYHLVRVDPSIGHLKNLVALDMTNCRIVVDLPILTSLETLIISGCWSLNIVPDNLDQMTSLTRFSFNGCNLPQDIPNLPPRLTTLKFSMSNSLQNVGLDSLSSLTTLEFSNCCSLQNIMLGSLSSLTRLSIHSCHSVRHVSDLPSSLTSLNVLDCRRLVKLSIASGGRLRNLKTLMLVRCSSLEEIEGADEELESLEQFENNGCVSLKKLPKLSSSKKLHCINISNTDISSFEGEGMDSLEELKVGDCKLLKKIPYMRDSKRLRELKIRFCQELTEIEHLEGYDSLQKLHIVRAPSLRMLSDDISTLKNLRNLDISNCCSMEILPDLSNLKKLRELHIYSCDMLLEIRGLDGLESLQALNLSFCKNLEILPNLSNLKKLWYLNIEGFHVFRILGLHTLESLQRLVIVDCSNLVQIHDLARLRSLKNLRIHGCSSLETLPDLSNLKELRTIWIEGCQKLPKIPGLDGLKCLEDLNIRLCNNLIEIHGLERLKSLETLHIERCPSLKSLPKCLNNLKVVSIKGCKHLPDMHLPVIELLGRK